MPASNKTEKVTFNLPSELKQEVVKLKATLNVSLNTIYKTVITEYIERQEIKKWEQGAVKASKNKEYKLLCKEIGHTACDMYDY